MEPPRPGSKELKKIGDMVKQARQEKSVSLRKLAEELELSPSYFSKLERGEALASNETYDKIWKALGLNHTVLAEVIGIVTPELQRLLAQAYSADAVQTEGMLRKIIEEQGKK